MRRAAPRELEGSDQGPRLVQEPEVATFDTIPLFTPGPSAIGGAVLYLIRPANRDALVRTPGGVEVEVRARCPALVVRGIQADSPESALRSSLDHAHRALDLVAMKGTPLALADPDAKHIAFWSTHGAARVQIWSVATLTMALGFTASVHVAGAAGPPAEPTLKWDESFRYFRHSQTTEDLFDAFRNGYLALESILSAIAPVSVRQPGALGKLVAFVLRRSPTGVSEGENAWLRRALTAAHGRVSLVPFTSTISSASNAPKKLYRELRAVRNGLFHAKRGIPAHLPYNPQSRAEVTDALQRLVRLYVALAGNVLDVHFASGGFTQYAFERMVSAGSHVVHVTDDSSAGTDNDTAVNPAGGKTMALPSQHDLALDTPFFYAVRGESPGAVVAGQVGAIRRIATTMNGMLATYDGLERPLSLEHVDFVEVVVGIRGLNAQSLKSRYSG